MVLRLRPPHRTIFFQPSEDAAYRGRGIAGNQIACSVLEMQDDQAIFVFCILGCVLHSRSGSGGQAIVFAEFNRAGADGLRLSVGEVLEKGRRTRTVDGVNQGLKHAFLVVGEYPTVRNAGPGL